MMVSIKIQQCYICLFSLHSVLKQLSIKSDSYRTFKIESHILINITCFNMGLHDMQITACEQQNCDCRSTCLRWSLTCTALLWYLCHLTFWKGPQQFFFLTSPWNTGCAWNVIPFTVHVTHFYYYKSIWHLVQN